MLTDAPVRLVVIVLIWERFWKVLIALTSMQTELFELYANQYRSSSQRTSLILLKLIDLSCFFKWTNVHYRSKLIVVSLLMKFKMFASCQYKILSTQCLFSDSRLWTYQDKNSNCLCFKLSESLLMSKDVPRRRNWFSKNRARLLWW